MAFTQSLVWAVVLFVLRVSLTRMGKSCERSIIMGVWVVWCHVVWSFIPSQSDCTPPNVRGFWSAMENVALFTFSGR